MSYWANGSYDKFGQLESEDVTGNMMSDPLFNEKSLMGLISYVYCAASLRDFLKTYLEILKFYLFKCNTYSFYCFSPLCLTIYKP